LSKETIMKKMLIVATAGAVFAALSPAFAQPYDNGAINTDNIGWNRGGPYRTDTITGAVECYIAGELVPCGSNAQSAAPAQRRERQRH
jgi:hypothetical protein